jgi:hypothetical protein
MSSPRLALRSMPRDGACCAFEDPGRSALAAAVFWQPTASAFVFPVDAMPASHDPGGCALDLAALCCRTTCFTPPDGTRHILFAKNGRWLQLAVRGATDGDRLHLLTTAIIAPAHLARRVLLLRRLSGLVAHKTLERVLFPPDPHSRRLGLIVQALDGRLAAASYREIAIALFGEQRVKAEWTDPRGHLRDQVRRAVRRGVFLMQGGYLAYLK